MRKIILFASVAAFLMIIGIAACSAYALSNVMKFDRRDATMCMDR